MKIYSVCMEWAERNTFNTHTHEHYITELTVGQRNALDQTLSTISVQTPNPGARWLCEFSIREWTGPLDYEMVMLMVRDSACIPPPELSAHEKAEELRDG